MDSLIFLPAAGISTVIIIYYIIVCARTPRRFELWTLLNVVVYCSGVVAGVVLILSTVIPSLRARLSGIEIYLFMAGAAVIAISLKPLLTDIFELPRQRRAAEPTEKGTQ